ncbi:MAG: hypothetical protein Q9M91_05790 [Candidatus Dojkabacteria bacterium]|nr:hypothetical protein [Candidatus Dojkabacteria bacterium]MDQ7021311.1 hypothetical protein [Candidatus Dojkabacteria bacterium]
MKSNITKLFLTSIIFIMLSIFTLNIVSAQGGGTVDLDTQFDLDSKISLQSITINYFPQPLDPGGEYATVLSWLSFFGILITIGAAVFWIFLLLKAGLFAFKSEGDEVALAESYKKVKSVFIGAGLSFLFPMILTVVGFAVGVGGIWTWPKAFRDCPNDPDLNFYFQAVLEVDESIPANRVDIEAETRCYGAPVFTTPGGSVTL